MTQLMLPQPRAVGLLPAPGQTTRKVRIFSFGGGVQSHAVLALQAMGKLPQPYDLFLMADVGRDSEHPDTVRYVDEVTKPFCDGHGINFMMVPKTTRGKAETLFEYIHRIKRGIPIPAFMSGGAPGNRSCTADFKIEVVNRYVRANKWTHAVTGLGISLDEYQRLRDTKWHDNHNGRRFSFWKKREYPLIDLRMNRQDALNAALEAGLPTPPRSACWFCPFTSRGRWIEMKTYRPELFDKAIALEEHINEKRHALGRDDVYLHRDLRPLVDAVPDQMLLPFIENTGSECDAGYCFV